MAGDVWCWVDDGLLQELINVCTTQSRGEGQGCTDLWGAVVVEFRHDQCVAVVGEMVQGQHGDHQRHHAQEHDLHYRLVQRVLLYVTL